KREVESWLSDLDVSREKTKWLTNIFEKMGEDPDLEDYIKPTEDDVWDFIGQIKNWLIDPNSNGIFT
ncbi:MAG: ATP-binding protein, partial [Nitrospinota bacterium]